MSVKKLIKGFHILIAGKKRFQETNLRSNSAMLARFGEWGYFNKDWSEGPRILMAAGHGFGNVGDEAQCGACVDRWLRTNSDCRITLFSPNPGYTEALHGQRVEWAPRVVWFHANTSNMYDDAQPTFYKRFRSVKWRMLLSAQMMRRRIPLLFCTPGEAKILHALASHDLFHISGGGFLTGKTRSRLWENCLLMRICDILGTPVLLTGHNIGVFQDDKDRRLARKGLESARYIGLRDRGVSEAELASIGIQGEHVESTCDDALLCPRLESEEVKSRLASIGVDPSQPWVAVHFHHWGQKPEDREQNEARFAEICDQLSAQEGLQPVFIAMTPSDVEPEQSVHHKMNTSGFILPYSPDYRVVRGVIADAALCFTMKHHPIVFAQGEGVPVVSVALEDYYLHKNKGAMANVGQEHLVSDREDFFSDTVLSMIQTALNDSEEMVANMRSYLNEMKDRELEIYQQVIRKWV